MKSHFAAAVALVMVASPAAAHSYKQGAVQIGHAWALPSTSASTQVFFPLANNGRKPDRLLSVTTPAAKSARMFDNATTAVATFALPVKAPLPMRPGARHIRLDGLVKPLRHGDKIPLTLRFEQAGTVTVEVWIEPSAYAPAPKGK
jgi:periplasmic copper chaperone A